MCSDNEIFSKLGEFSYAEENDFYYIRKQNKNCSAVGY